MYTDKSGTIKSLYENKDRNINKLNKQKKKRPRKPSDEDRTELVIVTVFGLLVAILFIIAL